MTLLQRWRDRLGRPVTFGLVGVLLLYLSIGAATSITVPVFHPDDEPRHAAYALALAEGRIPDISEPLPLKRMGLERIRTNLQLAAMHPPLYYLLVAPPVAIGVQTGQVGPWMIVARLWTLLMAVPGLLFSHRILRMLVPRRPEVATLTLAFVVLAPSFTNYAALVHTESLVFTTASGLFFHVFRAMIRGPRWTDIAWAAVWAGALCLTRFSGILVLGPALVGLGLAPLLHGEGPWVRRLARGVGAGVVVLAVAAAASGWFYAYNYLHYGDITGAGEALDILERPRRSPWYVQITRIRGWEIFHDHMWAQLGGVHPLKGSMRWVARAFTLPALIGLGIWLWDQRAAIRRQRWTDPRLVALGVGVLALAAVWLPVFHFFAKGGNYYPRYYFPVVWVPVLVVAVGWLGWRTRWASVVAVVYSAVVGYAVLDLYLTTIHRVGRQPRDLILAKMFAGAGIDAYWWPTVITLSAFSLGAVLVIRSLLEQGPAPHPDEAPEGPAPPPP